MYVVTYMYTYVRRYFVERLNGKNLQSRLVCVFIFKGFFPGVSRVFTPTTNTYSGHFVLFSCHFNRRTDAETAMHKSDMNVAIRVPATPTDPSDSRWGESNPERSTPTPPDHPIRRKGWTVVTSLLTGS